MNTTSKICIPQIQNKPRGRGGGYEITFDWGCIHKT